MSLPNEDLFTEKFALYLAVGLLGPEKVVEYLNDFERQKQPVVPLYWRSNPMIPGASRMLYHTTGTTDSTSGADPLTKILFFDATFTFVNNSERAKDSNTPKQKSTRSTRILVSFGFFLLLQKGHEAVSGDKKGTEFGSGHYVSSQPLNYEQILSYMNSLQLDRDSVSPEKFAESTAEEFLRQGSSSGTTEPKATTSGLKIDQEISDSKYALTVDYGSDGMSREEDIKQLENDHDVKSATSSDLNQGQQDSSSIFVNVPCKSMGDTNGKLMLKYLPSGVAKFDAPALRFLSWDFSKSPNRFDRASNNAETLLSNRDMVDEAYTRWQRQTELSLSTNDDNKNSGNQNSITPTESTTNGNSSGPVTNDKAKKRKRSKGMGILPSARRKRNKGLVYDSK